MVGDPLDPRAWNRFSYVYGNPVNFTDPSGHCIEDACILETTLLVGLVGGLINVGVNWRAAYQNGQNYDIWDYTTDLGIGTFYGILYYRVGLAGRLGLLRYPVLGGLSVLESATTAKAKGSSFDTNQAAWAFITGMTVPLVLGEGINFLTRRTATTAGEIIENTAEYEAYTRSLKITQSSIKAMRGANWEDAARIAKYQREFPMLQSKGRYYMSHYVEWNKGLVQLPRIQNPVPNTVATINTFGLLTSSAFADNEYLGLFNLPTLIPNPQILIPAQR